jgi:uncharacterized repeat protein (TIGR01451 family)
MISNALMLAFMLAAPLQTVAAEPQVNPAPPSIRVQVRSGDDNQNPIKSRSEVLLRVEVEDAAGNPAAGARVEFNAPSEGPGGAFANGSKSISVTANEAGIAEVRGFRPNEIAGGFAINVKVFYQGAEGSAVIRQRNIGSAASKKWLGILGGIGGGAGAIAAFCCGGDGDTTGPSNTPTGPSTPGSPNLTVGTTASAPTFVRGSVASFAVTVTNASDVATSGVVTVSDSIPAGLTATAGTGTGWTCGISGQTVTCSRSDALNARAAYPVITISVNVSPNATGSLTNSATVTGGGSAPASGSVTVNTTGGPDLGMSKTASASSFVRGGTGTFTLSARNNGGTATNGSTVTVSDAVPAGLTPTAANGTGWTCNISNTTVTCTRTDVLNAGAGYPAITVAVNVAANAAASITNSASVSGGGAVAVGTGSVTVGIAGTPDLTISKTASNSTFSRGAAGSFTLAVTNGGNVATTGIVTVTDPLPGGLTPTSANGGGWSCGISGQTVTCSRSDALTSGGSYPAITIAFAVASNANGNITNTATVSGGGDSTPADDSTTVHISGNPNLEISQNASGSTFTRGGPGSFTLTVNNSGDTETSGAVMVTDPLPNGLTPTSANGNGWACGISGQTATCSRSDALTSGASYPPITVGILVTSNASGKITNTATVSGGGAPAAAEGSTTVDIADGPNLIISKTSSAPSFVRRGAGTFTLIVTNNGLPTNGTPIIVTDRLPQEVPPAIATGTGWSCSIAGETVTCSRSNVLPSGASFPPISIMVSVENGASGTATNTASVVGGGDNSPAEGSVSFGFINNGGNPVFTLQSDQSVVAPGDSVAFTVAAENTTAVPLFDAALMNILPAGFVYAAGSARIHGLSPDGGGSALDTIEPVISGDGLRFSIKMLPAGGRVAITYAAIVTAKATAGELQSRVSGFARFLSGERLDAVPAQLRLVVRPSAFTPVQVVIGRVFEDRNRNATFDTGEPGIANVRVVTSTGQSATTDADGQYSLPSLAAGSALIAVDPATLPPGLALPPREKSLGGAGQLLRSPLGGGTTVRKNFALIRTSSASPSPPSTAKRKTVFDDASGRDESARRSPLFLALGELGIGLSGRDIGSGGTGGRVDGDVSIFYQDSPKGRDLLTVAVRSKESVNRAAGNSGLFEFDPTQHLYPVMGDASTQQQIAQSASRIYARYDREGSYIMFGDLRGDAADGSDGSLLGYDRNVTGLRFRLDPHQDQRWFEGQIARPESAYMREVATALAGPSVRLSRSQILPGSETITLEVRDRRNPERLVSRETLVRNVDYMLDSASGVLLMMRSLALFDSALNIVQLVSTYEYRAGGADSAMYMGRGSYAVSRTGLRFGFFGLSENQGGMNFAVGGLEIEQKLASGGRFKLQMPVSRGRLWDGVSAQAVETPGIHNGTAIRAEFEQPLALRQTVIRGQLNRTDNGFFNPYGAIAVQGQDSRAVAVETRGFQSGRLSFTMAKEINRNSAADNKRNTLSAKVSQPLHENLLAEAGIDRREFTDYRGGRNIDSHLVSAGIRWRPTGRLEASIVREQNLGEADPTYPNQTLLGTHFRISPSSRLFATQRLASAPIVPIGGSEISGLFSPESTRETAIGIESQVRRNASVTTRYRADSGPSGTDSFAVMGLVTRIPIRDGVSLDWSLDHAVHLAGKGTGYNGVSIGFSQSRGDKWRSGVRYELRRRDRSEQILSAGVAGQLTASTSALARYRINSSAVTTAGGANAQLALALRPRRSDRTALLFSYDSAASSIDSRRMSRVSADGLLQLRPGLEFYSRAAAARVPTSSRDSRRALYWQGRLQQALLKRFDIAGETRWLRESANISSTLAMAVEWGTWVSRDFRVGLGYSPSAYDNPGALLNSTAARGGAYLVISSRLSSLFDLVK